MVEPQTRFEELVEKLQAEDCRLTPQRLALLRILAESDRHPSAAHLHKQIKEQFPTTSLATVYKTLYVLKDMGEVMEYGFSTDDNRYDGNKPYPHPHLICIGCHEVIDAEVDIAQDLDQTVAERSGYEVVRHRLDFYGMCPACRDSS
jgi:Fur family peroxide stress response transcriptional regulator